MPVKKQKSIGKKPKKQKKNSITSLKRQAQTKFNAYIRQRDSLNGFFTCISCGEILPIDKMNAGHYFSVRGNDGLRFNEDNANGECVKCNGFDHSHLIFYGINLKNKIGEEKYNNLIKEAKFLKKTPKRWTEEELKGIKNEYEKKLK